jgi:cell division protein FtsX
MSELEKFKMFLKEETESKDEFRVEALLVISNKTHEMKSDVLSKIRAIEGITRVHVDEAIRRTYYEISKVTVKVNISPFGMVPLEQIFNKIRKDILNVDGVQRFTYIARPMRI